jgi:hypothetical protein
VHGVLLYDSLGGYLTHGNWCYCKGAMVGAPTRQACTAGSGFYRGMLTISLNLCATIRAVPTLFRCSLC